MNINSILTNIFHKTLIITGLGASMVGGSVIGLNLAAAVTNNSISQTTYSDELDATIDDAAIATNVKTKLMAERTLNRADINVTTINGVVRLTGATVSANAKSLAEYVAGKVVGVKSIDNNLIAPSNNRAVAYAERTISDSWMTTKVKSELLDASISRGVDVGVTTFRGVVVLKGTLASRDAVLHAKQIASKVMGVKSVDTVALVVART